VRCESQHIPTSVLQGLAPLQAYPQAAHSGRISRPEWEAEMLDLALPASQLALPFTYEAWRQLESTRLLTGMT
jgi:hypothetical protein